MPKSPVTKIFPFLKQTTNVIPFLELLIVNEILKKGKAKLGMYYLSQVAFQGQQKFTSAWNGVRYNKLLIATGMMSLSNFFLKIFNTYLLDS